MINVDLRRYGTDKDYEQFINGYLKGADIGDNPSECQFVCRTREAIEEENKKILVKIEEKINSLKGENEKA